MGHPSVPGSRNNKAQGSRDRGGIGVLEERRDRQDPQDNSSGQGVPERNQKEAKARPGWFCTSLPCHLIYTFERTLETDK